MIQMEQILDRFLRYVAIDTQSNEESESQPSTSKQLNLLKLLCKELNELGVEAELDEYGYVMGRIPSNVAADLPAVGFIAHVDTAPDASGENVKPQIIKNYDGSDIPLKGVPGLALKPSEFPELLRHVGETIITTDGTTLLGADDKAGVAEIMDAVQYIMAHPEFRHGHIRIGFTPDEEIGRGVVRFDVARFDAKYAYTMDGGEAKGKMRNAILIGQELNSLLPVEQRPEYTEGYEGFFHLISFKGSVEEADFAYIIRDHSRELFEKKKVQMQQCADFINAKYGAGTATLVLKDQYYNMREQVEPHYQIVEIARKAIADAGLEPRVQPIRGGTDGANLSFRGLPCPNIFAGGLNFHGKMEWVPLESMEKASQVILNILSEFAK